MEEEVSTNGHGSADTWNVIQSDKVDSEEKT
jgi:hypothetical protein